MSNAQLRWFAVTIVAAIALGLAAPMVYAFNPQPDPPARTKGNQVINDKGLNKGGQFTPPNLDKTKGKK
jgi:hypothetical protein